MKKILKRKTKNEYKKTTFYINKLATQIFVLLHNLLNILSVNNIPLSNSTILLNQEKYIINILFQKLLIK